MRKCRWCGESFTDLGRAGTSTLCPQDRAYPITHSRLQMGWTKKTWDARKSKLPAFRRCRYCGDKFSDFGPRKNANYCRVHRGDNTILLRVDRGYTQKTWDAAHPEPPPPPPVPVVPEVVFANHACRGCCGVPAQF